MTESTFNKIKEIEKDLEIMAVQGHDPNPHSGILGKLELIKQEYAPGSKPTDFGCRACTQSLIKDVWNTYKRYESTISK